MIRGRDCGRRLGVCRFRARENAASGSPMHSNESHVYLCAQSSFLYRRLSSFPARLPHEGKGASTGRVHASRIKDTLDFAEFLSGVSKGMWRRGNCRFSPRGMRPVHTGRGGNDPVGSGRHRSSSGSEKAGPASESLKESAEDTRRNKAMLKVVMGLGTKKQGLAVLALLKSARDRGEVYNEYVYSAAIKAVGDSGLWQESLRLLGEVPVFSRHCYSAAMVACGKAKRPKAALRLLEDIHKREGAAMDASSCNAAVRACNLAGAHALAVGTLQRLVERGVQLDAHCYTSAILSCASLTDTRTVMELLRQMIDLGIPANVSVFEAAITACGEAGELDLALSLLSDMERTGVEPDKLCYTAAIAACGYARDVKGAFRLLEELRARRIPYDVALLNVLLGVSAGAGAWREARSLLQDMKTSVAHQPNIGSYMQVLLATLKAKELEEAVAVFEDAKHSSGVEVDEFMYHALAAALFHAGRSAQARALLDEMTARGLKPNLEIMAKTDLKAQRNRAGLATGPRGENERLRVKK